MLAYSTTDSTADVVDAVQLKVLSAAEIRKLSVVNITETMLYTKSLPTPHGLLDHRMGVIDRRLSCGTCSRCMAECQGHPGHIDLHFPMYHALFFETTLKVLRATCFCCASVVGEGDEREGGLEGRAALAHLCNAGKAKRRCPKCDAPRPTLVRHNGGVRAEWPADAEWASEEERAFCTAEFSQRDAYSILDNLSDDDARALGFRPDVTHPRDLMVTALLIPPPCVRPSISADEGSKTRAQDDLTHKLQDILKRNTDVAAAIGEGRRWATCAWTPELAERVARLQYEVYTLMSNAPKMQRVSLHGGGANMKSIIQRIKGKDGRIRGNLMGKRVDFSARSVVSPGPTLDVDEVGVPRRIARTLTVPETVNAYNVADLTARVRRGPDVDGGAQVVIAPDGTVIDLGHCQRRDTLQLPFGAVVERTLVDGDVVIFNRQPSLHKPSLMGHRVKLVDTCSFQVNLSVTAPYNADFDGDEMNLHVPQSVSARADVGLVMSVVEQIVSPAANKPCFALVQDSLLGAYLLTHDGALFDQRAAAELLISVRHARPLTLPPPAVHAWGAPRWTGRQLASALLPPLIHLDKEPCKRPRLADFEGGVVVRGGAVLAGRFTKAVLGTAAGGLVDLLARASGRLEACRFLSDMQRLTRAFMARRGFNVGVRDCVVGAAGDAEVKARIRSATRVAEEITQHLQEASAAGADAEMAEATIRRVLAKALTQAGAVVERHCREGNAIRCMVACGSKGSTINISQIGGCVGQQAVEGKRPAAAKGSRALPCFAFGDRSLESRGFVHASYAAGLNASEFFFHCMAGREGLVDTAVKTSQTGYLQRRQVKAMESHVVHADGSVRNGSGDVVQFVYADAGLDPSRAERVPLDFLRLAPDAVRAAFGQEDAGEAEAFLKERDALLRAATPPVPARGCVPFHVTRALALHLRGRARPSDASASRSAREALLAYDLAGERCALARLWMRLALPPARAARHPPAELEALRAFARAAVREAGVPAGEMVGCIAAQSIGEPTTQLTLNTFPSAGIATKNVTLGIPRLQELFSVAKTMKLPSLTLALKAPLGAAVAAALADTLPLTVLGDVVVSVDIVDDPDPSTSVVAQDACIARATWALELGGAPPADASVSRFVARLALDADLMRQRRVSLPALRRLVRKRLAGRAIVDSSEANDLDPVLRVRLLHADAMAARAGLPAEVEAVLAQRLARVLLKTLVVSGHAAVRSAATRAQTADEVVVDAAGRRSVATRTQHVVDTTGSSLADARALPLVDWERTYCNDVSEVQSVLGIGAAAAVLYKELTNVISFDGTYVFPGHLQLVVDTMTREGVVKPLSRFGVNRDTESALSRSTFEETPDILSDAAMFAERDPVSDVSTNIILGQRAAIGTGAAKVKFHPQMLPPSLPAGGARPLVARAEARGAAAAAEGSLEYDVAPPFAESGDGAGALFASRECEMPYVECPDDDDAPAPKTLRFALDSPEASGDEGE